MTQLNTDVETLAKYINLIDFPCEKQDLIAYAESHDAPDDVIEAFEQMPDGRYADSAEVARQLGISSQVRIS